MYQLENSYLKIQVCGKGAEVQSIFDKEMEKEILWNGDEKYWERRSPVLFPNVGRHHGNCYLYQGKRFDTVQHGFARDADFQCISHTETALTFQLKETAETKAYFPFSFTLEITYRLTERSLEVLWKVKNTDRKTMYFTIGGHPGFMVPILEDTCQTDYKLLFGNKEALTYRLVYGATGTADGDKTYTLPLTPYGDYMGCDIGKNMFEHDALIFDDSQISCAGIGYPDGTPYILMECSGFTNFGIWSKPGAPFICLEPWQGRCDDYGFQGEISEKPDVITLAADDVFEKMYRVTVYKK